MFILMTIHLSFASCDKISNTLEGECLNIGATERTMERKKCESEYKILKNSYQSIKHSECPDCIDETIDRIKECFLNKCFKDCKKLLRDTGMCDNIDINQECNVCDTRVFSLDSLKEKFSECAKNQAHNRCNEHIKKMQQQKGAQLVCGNVGCEDFCRTQVARQAIDNSRNCRDSLTAEGGFSYCVNESIDQVDRRISEFASNLPDGFYWQKCAYGMPCASEIKMAFNQAEQECNSLKSKATICCEDPLKCAEAGTNDLFKSAGSVAGGITENCQRIQERLKNVGSVTQQMADKCKSVASSCVQVCTQQISENFLSTFNKYCNFDFTRDQAYDRNSHTCEGDLISDYVREYSEKLASIPGQCELVGQKSEQLKQSAEEMLRSSASAQKCAEQASASTSESEPSPEEPTQMAVLDPDTPNVKTPPTPDTSLRWNPGKGEKGKENIISNNTGGSSNKASKRTNKNPVRRANIGAKKAPPTPAKKKKGFLSKLLSAFGGSKKNKEKQKEVGGPQASSSNNANVGGGGRDIAKKKAGLAGKDKTKADKKSKEYASRKFTKAGSGKISNKRVRSVLDMGIKPRDISSVKLGKYGSPHDNIFERLSHRIITLCRQKRINDCHL